jgi:hypothetical protein
LEGRDATEVVIAATAWSFLGDGARIVLCDVLAGTEGAQHGRKYWRAQFKEHP